MKKITLYSTRTCGFCRAAKSLLDNKGISYKEIDISSKMINQIKNISQEEKSKPEVQTEIKANKNFNIDEI